CRVVRSFAPVAQSRTIQPDQLARTPLTQPVTLHHLHHCFSPRRRLQTFFPSRSLSAALSSIDSASSFFQPPVLIHPATSAGVPLRPRARRILLSTCRRSRSRSRGAGRLPQSWPLPRAPAAHR